MKFHWHLHWLLAGKQFNFGLALLLLLHSRNVLGLGLQLGQPMAAPRTGWDIAPSRPSLLVTFIVSVCSTAHHQPLRSHIFTKFFETNGNKFQAEPSANSRARQLDNSMVGNITRIRFPVALSLSNLSLSLLPVTMRQNFYNRCCISILKFVLLHLHTPASFRFF